MATVHGEDNAWLRALVVKRGAALWVYGAFLSGSVICAAAYDARLGLALLAVGIALARRRRGLARRYRYAVAGAAGELETAKMLALLPAGFTVVNDFAFQRFNVDHVVVGSTGVWVVETKSHPGVVVEHADSVWLNGRPMYRDPRRQARAGAVAIGELLAREIGKRCWVEALVCFPNATVTANGHPAAASIVSRVQLLSRLRLAPPRLTPDQRDRIADALSRVKDGRDRAAV